MAEEKESTTVIDDNQVEMDVGEFEEKEVNLETAESENAEDSGSEDEVEKEHTSTQKRINALTKKMRTAEREREEAISYAQSVHNENERVKERLKQVDQGYMSEYSGRLEAEEKAAQTAYKAAVRNGNPDAQFEAQTQLTSIQVNKQKLNEARRIAEARANVEKAQPQQQPQTAAATTAAAATSRRKSTGMGGKQ